MKVPRKGVRSPPRFELSGSEPSDEPQSRSVNSPEKATPTPRATEWAAITTAAKPRVVVEGMRKATSTDESDGALLRRGMPGGAEAVVKVITPSPGRRRLLAARMRRHPLRYAANARPGRVAVSLARRPRHGTPTTHIPDIHANAPQASWARPLRIHTLGWFHADPPSPSLARRLQPCTRVWQRKSSIRRRGPGRPIFRAKVL